MALTKEEKEKIRMNVRLIKEAYEKAFKGNQVIIQDLRSFCDVNVPTDMNPAMGNIDVSKVLVKTGRASVFQRIEYWLNMPVEQIETDTLNKWEHKA